MISSLSLSLSFQHKYRIDIVMASRKRTPSQQSQKTHTEPRTTFKKDRTETIRGYFSWKEVDCVLIKTIARRDLRPISVRVRILRKRSSYRPFNLLIRAQIRIGTTPIKFLFRTVQETYTAGHLLNQTSGDFISPVISLCQLLLRI